MAFKKKKNKLFIFITLCIMPNLHYTMFVHTLDEVCRKQFLRLNGGRQLPALRDVDVLRKISTLPCLAAFGVFAHSSRRLFAAGRSPPTFELNAPTKRSPFRCGPVSAGVRCVRIDKCAAYSVWAGAHPPFRRGASPARLLPAGARLPPYGVRMFCGSSPQSKNTPDVL